MIKTTWATLNKPAFSETLQKLFLKDAAGNQPVNKLDAVAKMRMGIIAQTCYIEMTKAQKEVKELLKKYATKDEKGEIAGYPEQSKITFPTPEIEHKYDTEFADLMLTKFKIAVDTVPVSSLEPLNLTVDELVGLKPVLQDN